MGSADEQARLAALFGYDILDTEAEQAFDDIARLAAQICGTPMALVSLVDERRQWFKARVGLDIDETPREVAFCDHTIRQQGVFEVTDAAADPRFDANPLVIGQPELRFYAGATLQTADGQALGSLCVLDRSPRTLTQDQRDALAALARQTMAQIELRRRLAVEREAEKHRALLTAELQHRIKNTLAVVQGIVSQSLKSAKTPEEARDTIGSRLATLAKAHDLLTATSWKAAPIAAIVEDAVSLQGGPGDRVRIAGPDVFLNARTALALAMTLHELATNAVKYGALSNDAGQVSFTWSLEGAGNDRQLVMEWREQGGPPVTLPSRSGFGTRLMQGLGRDLGANGEVDYAPDGVRWTRRSPLRAVEDG